MTRRDGPPAETARRTEQLLGRRPAAGSRPDQLRRLQAMRVLERIGTADVRRLPSARPHWVLRFPVRRVLPLGLVALVIDALLLVRFDLKETDRHYMTHKSIHQAENLACMCHLKRDADGRCPAKLADLPGIPSGDLIDASGEPVPLRRRAERGGPHGAVCLGRADRGRKDAPHRGEGGGRRDRGPVWPA